MSPGNDQKIFICHCTTVQCAITYKLKASLINLGVTDLLDCLYSAVPSWKHLGTLRRCTTITPAASGSSYSSTFPRTETSREAASLIVSFTNVLVQKFVFEFVHKRSSRCKFFLDFQLSDLLEKVSFMLGLFRTFSRSDEVMGKLIQ